jgi:hypothetical protein
MNIVQHERGRENWRSLKRGNNRPYLSAINDTSFFYIVDRVYYFRNWQFNTMVQPSARSRASPKGFAAFAGSRLLNLGAWLVRLRWGQATDFVARIVCHNTQ